MHCIGDFVVHFHEFLTNHSQNSIFTPNRSSISTN